MSGLITQQELCAVLSKKIDDSDTNSKLNRQQIGALTSLKTNSKDTLVNSINELYTNTVNGKKLIIDAIKEITGDNTINDNLSFEELHDKIVNSQSYPVTDAYLNFVMDFRDLEVNLHSMYCLDYCGFVEYNNKLYCMGIGGAYNSIQVMEIDLKNKSHKLLKRLSTGTNGMEIKTNNNVVLYNGKIFYYQNGKKYIYDIESDILTVETPNFSQSVSLSRTQRCSIGKFMYTFGYHQTNGVSNSRSKDCYKINLENDEVTKLPEPPYSFGDASPVLVGNKIYVICGSILSDTNTLIQVFDTVNNTWEYKTSMNDMKNQRCVLYNNKIYIFDIYGEQNYDESRKCYEYDISNNSIKEKMHVPDVNVSNAFMFKNNICLLGSSKGLIYVP